MRGADVLRTADACRELLAPHLEASWEVGVPGLEVTVAEVVAHAASGPLWYALDLWSGQHDDAAFEVTVKSDAPNHAVLLSLSVAARVCAAGIDAAPPGTRGYHPAARPTRAASRPWPATNRWCTPMTPLGDWD